MIDNNVDELERLKEENKLLKERIRDLEDYYWLADYESSGEEPIKIELTLNSREYWITYIDTDKECINPLIPPNNSVSSSFTVRMSSATDKDIIRCYGTYVNEQMAFLREEAAWIFADDETEAGGLSFQAMENSRGYLSYIEDDDANGECGSIYIDRLFIKPEYRNKKIASFIFKQLADLFWQKYNIYIRYACVFVKPDEQDEMPEEQMRAIMIKTLVKVGFKNASKKEPNIYYKYYELDEHPQFLESIERNLYTDEIRFDLMEE